MKNKRRANKIPKDKQNKTQTNLDSFETFEINSNETITMEEERKKMSQTLNISFKFVNEKVRLRGDNKTSGNKRTIR